jgi:hypothetical protein
MLSIADAHACTKWHTATRDLDRRRIVLMEAAIEGREVELDPAEKIGTALVAATRFDEQAARWFGEIQGCLAFPSNVLSREGVLDHILTVTAGAAPEPIPGPDRQRLLELVSG